MAGSSLLMLLDDIAAVLDDVALMTKMAAKKTAGVLGDDFALNAQQVSGVRAERELPVVWAVAKGSFRNKLILVPCRAGHQRVCTVGGHAAADGGRRLFVFRGVREAGAHIPDPQQERRSPGQRRPCLTSLAGAEVDLAAFEKGQNQGRNTHRLHPLGRNHCNHPGHRF
ncbi:MAG: Inner membrane protein [Pseudomonas fragi]